MLAALLVECLDWIRKFFETLIRAQLSDESRGSVRPSPRIAPLSPATPGAAFTAAIYVFARSASAAWGAGSIVKRRSPGLTGTPS